MSGSAKKIRSVVQAIERGVLAAGLVGVVIAAPPAAAAAAGAPLRFDRVFKTTGEPAALHYRATYEVKGLSHELEVWRDGDRRLVRRTDDAIETHVAKRAGSASYQMVILDVRRKIETRVTRDDLYRVGNFTDWFDLAHGLRYPKGNYRLTASPPGTTPAVATTVPCRWYLLEQGAVSTRICWSAREHLPIALLGANDRPLWRVGEVNHTPASNAVFEVRDQGFVRNDASHDISGD